MLKFLNKLQSSYTAFMVLSKLILVAMGMGPHIFRAIYSEYVSS